jgi:hypothetical protein
MKIVFCRHKDDGRNLLFETTENIQKGESLLVDTMYGEKYAEARSASIEIADDSIEDFAECCGAYLPLKKVVGRYELKRFGEERKFKVGDRVRIRQWDDMENEFGLDFGGDIECRFSFTSEMKHLCGMVADITSIDGERVYLDFGDYKGNTSFSYSTDMLERID